MTLRATAPAFLPSFEAVSQRANGNDNRHESKEQLSSRRRRRGGQRRTQSKQQKEVIIDNKNQHPQNQINSRQKKRRGKRREKQHQDENPFPPLVGDTATITTKSCIANTRDVYGRKKTWLGVAERAHADKEEEDRQREAIRLSKLQDETTVCLTPLVRSSSTSAMPETTSLIIPQECNTNEAVDTNLPTAHEPRYCAHVDMTKLRNRWWQVLREQNVREKQKLEEENDSSDNESHGGNVESSSWDKTVVETKSFHPVEPKHPCVDPNVLQSWLSSSFPLHRAVMQNDEKAIRILLTQQDKEAWIESFVEASQLGINIESALDSFSPLLLAVCLNKPHLVKLLAEASPADLSSNGPTALMLAAEMGLEGCIRELLACGASLLERDDKYDTAIHYACRAGVEASVVRSLLLTNTNRSSLLKIVSFKNAKGQTPLHVACQHSYGHIVDVFLTVCASSLLQKLFQIRDGRNQTPLLTAVRADSADIVMSLLMWRSNDQGKSFKAKDLLSGDCCPLACAASTGSTDMVSLLLEFMDPLAEETSSSLNYALQEAVRSTTEYRLENIRVLVEAGANPCTSLTEDVSFPSTALSVACAKGDVLGLSVMLDSWDSYTTLKQTTRRQDPRLRRQPESYFAAIEAKENAELRNAMTSALVLSLFLGYFDNDIISHRLAAAITLYHRGAQLNPADYAVLKASIRKGRPLSSTEASITSDGDSFASSYNHPIHNTGKKLGSLGSYDRSPLQYWSQVLFSMEWMRSERCVQCSWMVVRGSKPGNIFTSEDAMDEEQVILVAGGERFVVNASLVSQKSAKLAAAIRFEESTRGVDESLAEIELGISSHSCRWLLQHIYHGSIVSGFHTDPLQCASDLLELAMIAEEFICPSLLRECEMRLLSSDPFGCYCWSCCSAVRESQCISNDSATPCGECLVHVDGSSRLLTAECVLDALAVSSELQAVGTTDDRSIIRRSSSQVGKTSNQLWSLIDKKQLNYIAPFMHAKDSAIQVCLCDFTNVTETQAFLSQIDLLVSDDVSSKEAGGSNVLQAQSVLLLSCLWELSAMQVSNSQQQPQTTFRAQPSQQVALNIMK
jgi:ankyrin repeat protein